MTTRTISTLGTAGRFVSSAVRVVNDVVSAVGDGIRARNEFCARVGRGTDPAEAIAGALRQIGHR